MSGATVWMTGPVAEKRWGLKGPRAAEVLADAGLAVPAHANSWAPLGDGPADMIARLGNSEFFIEHGAAIDTRALEASLAAGVTGAYPVPREDCALVLGGAAANEALAQVCNVDFAALDLAARPIVMTSMIGVGVLVLPQAGDGHLHRGMAYRIWCDPSFGSYLESSLRAVVEGSTRNTA
jgi:sarcosine oxidase subunit gamma